MRFNIQRFATWDELTNYYNNNLNQTQAKINELQAQKEADISGYEANYQNQLQQYQDLQNQQQNYIDAWAANQKEQQQKQTDFNISLIEQNKKEAAEEKEKEVKDAYTDYMKQTNQYGGALENLASRGLANQGYAESSKVAMYNTYQNRVATANEALTKANVQYDNQIQQALLNNDAALAETALEQMKQSYQLALSGFDYTSNLYNQKLSYLQNLESLYFDKETTLRGMANTYANQLGEIAQYREQYGSGSGGSGGSGGDNIVYDDKSGGNYEVNTPYYQGSLNPDAKNGVFSTKDSNGNAYQPDNVGGNKLYNSGLTVALKTSTLNGESKTVTQKVWTTPDGTLYYWDGRKNQYVKFTKKLNSSEQKTLDSKLAGLGFGSKAIKNAGGYGGGSGGKGGF